MALSGHRCLRCECRLSDEGSLLPLLTQSLHSNRNEWLLLGAADRADTTEISANYPNC
jgi:hypothetical protein